MSFLYFGSSLAGAGLTYFILVGALFLTAIFLSHRGCSGDSNDGLG